VRGLHTPHQSRHPLQDIPALYANAGRTGAVAQCSYVLVNLDAGRVGCGPRNAHVEVSKWASGPFLADRVKRERTVQRLSGCHFAIEARNIIEQQSQITKPDVTGPRGDCDIACMESTWTAWGKWATARLRRAQNMGFRIPAAAAMKWRSGSWHRTQSGREVLPARSDLLDRRKTVMKAWRVRGRSGLLLL